MNNREHGKQFLAAVEHSLEHYTSVALELLIDYVQRKHQETILFVPAEEFLGQTKPASERRVIDMCNEEDIERLNHTYNRLCQHKCHDDILSRLIANAYQLNDLANDIALYGAEALED